MRIRMLCNSLTFANDMPQTLTGLTDAEVIHHARSGWRLIVEVVIQRQGENQQ